MKNWIERREKRKEKKEKEQVSQANKEGRRTTAATTAETTRTTQTDNNNLKDHNRNRRERRRTRTEVAGKHRARPFQFFKTEEYADGRLTNIPATTFSQCTTLRNSNLSGSLVVSDLFNTKFVSWEALAGTTVPGGEERGRRPKLHCRLCEPVYRFVNSWPGIGMGVWG